MSTIEVIQKKEDKLKLTPGPSKKRKKIVSNVMQETLHDVAKSLIFASEPKTEVLAIDIKTISLRTKAPAFEKIYD